MNKFEKALERIEKNAEIQDSWTEEDLEHYKTITEALKRCAKECKNDGCREIEV